MAENMYFRTTTNNMQTNLANQTLAVIDNTQQGQADCYLSLSDSLYGIQAEIYAMTKTSSPDGISYLIDAGFTYKDSLKNAGSFSLTYDWSTKEFVTEFDKQTTSGTETTINRYSVSDVITANRVFEIYLTFMNGVGYFDINRELGKPLAYRFDSPVYISDIQLRSNTRYEELVYKLNSNFEFEGESPASFTLLDMFPPVMTGSTNSKFLPASEPDLRYLTVIPSAEAQTFTPTDGADGFYRVDVFAANSDIDPNIQMDNIKQGVTILGMPGRLVEFKPTQKAITIGTDATFPVKYYPEGSANGFSEFAINGITNLEASNIKKGVTIAGVAGSLEEKKLRTKYADIPSYYPLPYTINPDSNFNGMDKVIISTIGNLSADNIKSGVTIAGVKGTVVEKKAQAKTTSLAPDDSLPYVIEPSTGYNALDSVTITGITNLTAANIKKDVQIAGVTGTYEGSSSGGTRVVQASNNNNHAYPAGSKVYVFCLNNNTFHIQSPASIKAPEYLRSCAIGVTNEAIDMGATGSVTLLTDIGTDYGLFRASANGEHGGFFVNRSPSAITSGDNYLCYLPGSAGTTSDMQYAYIVTPMHVLSDWGNYSTLACFSLRRTGTYANSDFVLAGKLTNEEPDSITRVENDTDDVIRFYYKGEDSAGALLRVGFKNANGQWQYLDYTDHFLTNIGDNLRVEVRLQEGNNIKVFVNSSIVDDYQIDLTASVRAFALFNTVDQASYRFLLASSSSSGTPSLGCFCRVNRVDDDFYLGAKYFD